MACAELPIGIFGGTFDPVHYGHLRPALELAEALGLAEVRMLPCGQPPHRGEPAASAEQRLAMLERALAGQQRLVIDGRELERPGPSYMVDTLESLREELGERPLCLLLGLDALLGLPRWHQWQRLIELAHIVVAHRPGWALDEVPADPNLAKLLAGHRVGEVAALAASPAGALLFHPVTPLAISASEIRALVRAGRSPAYLLPDSVLHYIEQNRLYSE